MEYWHEENVELSRKQRKEMPFSDLKPINLNKIQGLDFPKSEYFAEEFEKYQIVLHHTVSGPGHRGDILTWKRNKSRVATHIVIARDGTPYQLFNSKYWGWHLGTGGSYLDKHSISIELDNWGPLYRKNNSLYTVAYDNKVNVGAMRYPEEFRGYELYERYTEEQVRTAGELILYWHKAYDIPVKYNRDMWDVSKKALDGQPGIWSHVSYREADEKQDCHPQPDLKEMLMTLEKLA